MLQQNEVKRISDAFKQLIKLKELRIDRNRLTSVENLINCGALKVLDLSYNQIGSIEVGLFASTVLEAITIGFRGCLDCNSCLN